jgi:hypothetical protein
MLTQQMSADMTALSGTLSVTCPAGGLAELIGLAQELELRSNVTTNGTINYNTPPPAPTPPDGGGVSVG